MPLIEARSFIVVGSLFANREGQTQNNKMEVLAATCMELSQNTIRMVTTLRKQYNERQATASFAPVFCPESQRQRCSCTPLSHGRENRLESCPSALREALHQVCEEASLLEVKERAD